MTVVAVGAQLCSSTVLALACRRWPLAQTTCWPQLLLGRERAASTGYKHVLEIKCPARPIIRSPELGTRAIKLQEQFVKL